MKQILNFLRRSAFVVILFIAPSLKHGYGGNAAYGQVYAIVDDFANLAVNINNYLQSGEAIFQQLSDAYEKAQKLQAAVELIDNIYTSGLQGQRIVSATKRGLGYAEELSEVSEYLVQNCSSAYVAAAAAAIPGDFMKAINIFNDELVRQTKEYKANLKDSNKETDKIRVSDWIEMRANAFETSIGQLYSYYCRYIYSLVSFDRQYNELMDEASFDFGLYY